MALFKNFSLPGVLRILPVLLGVAVIGFLVVACTNRLSGSTGAPSAGIPTQAPAAAAQAAAPNPPPTVAPANTNPPPTNGPIVVAPVNPNPPAAAPAGTVPTVQPVIVGEGGEVRVPAAGGAPAQPVDNGVQSGISPAPVLDTQTDSACGQRLTHVVAPGENLFRIAYRYKTTTFSVARLNGISNTRRLSVGRSLVVVTCDRAGGGYTGGGGTGRRYVVQPGDNLFRLGIRFGTTAESIRATNNLPGYVISVGQVLTMP